MTGKAGAACDWSAQDLAELYRIRDQLASAGLAVVLTTGLTDEQEPWAAFERSQTAEVYVHIARLNGELVVVNAVTLTSYQGRDFRAVADQLLGDAPRNVAPTGSRDGKIAVHPRSAFVAFIAATMAVSEFIANLGRAHAAEVATPEAKAALGRDLFSGVLDRIMGRDAALPSAVITGSAAAVVLTTAIGAFALSRSLEAEALPDHTQAQASALSTTDQEAAVLLASVASDTGPAAEIEVTQDSSASQPLTLETPAHTEWAGTAEETPLATTERARDGNEVSTAEVAVLTEFVGKSLVVEQLAEPNYGSQRGQAVVPGESKAAAPSSDAGSLRGVETLLASALVDLTRFTTEEIEQITQEIAQIRTTSLEEPADSSRFDPVSGNPMPSLELMTSQAINDKMALYVAPGKPASATMQSGRTDIVVFGDQDLVISNFHFGEDFIFTSGVLNGTDWIRSIQVIDDDVVITGTNGHRLTLIDAFPTIV